MNLFQMKSTTDGVNRMAAYLEHNYVSIGWSGLGDLENSSREELKERLASVYNVHGQELEAALEEVSTFVHDMTDGDYVIVGDEDEVHLGDLGDYFYVGSLEAEEVDGSHRRGVTWLKSLPRLELKGELQHLLNHSSNVSRFGLPVTSTLIESWLSKSLEETGNQMRVDPKLVEEALHILSQAMRSEDMDRRERAAIAILQYAQPRLNI
ncbi:hypothetical protein [Cohnella abietis]|uniref:Uncharacterized protein n=1 Tax=Cohnella abietis TaxID=2507935 RepID=A0A3T1CZT1_9BACL|nr:hypothetical protein [Cohnella abietis]BBI31350.1 hypothetical protein KCTCHS21_07490 [Cohnella abietis]